MNVPVPFHRTVGTVQSLQIVYNIRIRIRVRRYARRTLPRGCPLPISSVILSHKNVNVSGTSVWRSTITACAGVGFTFICFWNAVWDCQVPALIPSTPR